MAAGSLGQPINSLIPVRMPPTFLTQLRHPVEPQHLSLALSRYGSDLISRFLIPFFFLLHYVCLHLGAASSATLRCLSAVLVMAVLSPACYVLANSL